MNAPHPTKSTSPTNSSRGLILSVACSYTPAQLAPFVESWRRNVPNSDLVLIAGHLPEETDRYLSANQVIVIPAEFNRHAPVGWRKAWHRLHSLIWLRLTAGPCRWLGTNPGDAFYRQISEASFHLCSQRFFHYQRYLAHFGWKYSDVLLVDSRDTVFQTSPFPCQGLHVFAENENIGTSHFSKRWFQLSYGNRVFRELSHLALFCAGITLGDTQHMRRYLEVICAELSRLGAFTDIDQAVHNFLIHRKLVPTTQHAFGEGAGINLNATPLNTLNVIDGKLCNTTNRPIPIVHQYDRVRGLDLIEAHPDRHSASAPTSHAMPAPI